MQCILLTPVFLFQQMQAEVDSLHMEVKRKEAGLELATSEKERSLLKLKNEEGSVLYRCAFFQNKRKVNYDYRLLYMTTYNGSL